MDSQLGIEEKKLLFPKRTKRAFLWMSLSNEPFLVVYLLLPFILRKNLGASILEISVLSALRPIMPVFSFYWSMNLQGRKNLLRANLMKAWFFARIPFVFVFWFDHVWYVIFCCAIYEFFNKSGVPALVEILKINLPDEERKSAYSFYFMLSFLESILLGFMIAFSLKEDSSLWQFFLPAFALIGLSSLFFQRKIPIEVASSQPIEKKPLLDRAMNPWKETFSLLKLYPDFARFQYGFMLGGFSLMLIAPSLPIYFVDVLQISHSSAVTSRSILMGVGIVVASNLWKKALVKERIVPVTQLILLGFAIYLICLLFAKLSIVAFFLAFFFYGVAQAGSHLLWNLSGIIFSEKEDSSPFSRLNILLLGLRGMVAPLLGGYLCTLYGPYVVLLIGTALCFTGICYMQLFKIRRVPADYCS